MGFSPLYYCYIASFVSRGKTPIAKASGKMTKILSLLILCVVVGVAWANLGCQVSCSCGFGHKKLEEREQACKGDPELPDEEENHTLNAYILNHGLVKGVVCDYCNKLMKYLETQVIKGKGRDFIIKKMQEKCNTLKWWQKKPCKLLVKHVGNKVADLIAKGVQLADVCRRLHICNKAYEEEGESD